MPDKCIKVLLEKKKMELVGKKISFDMDDNAIKKLFGKDSWGNEYVINQYDKIYDNGERFTRILVISKGNDGRYDDTLYPERDLITYDDITLLVTFNNNKPNPPIVTFQEDVNDCLVDDYYRNALENIKSH